MRQYLQHTHNWRCVCDERGLTNDERNKFDTGLDDLMPWHKDDGLRDFSLLEVNRYVICTVYLGSCCSLLNAIYNHRSVGGVRGFTRETLIALIANNESMSYRPSAK